MTDDRKGLGKWGEGLAARYLEDKGYQVVARNWRNRQGEIDLVAQAGQVWVFVEVKTRRGRATGTPEEGVTWRKGHQLLELAQAYLLAHELEDVEWRIDVVAVELDGHGRLLRCEHIPNAVTDWWG
ncbi:MAG: YraN family protein [Chloroflexota bacterium]